MSMDSPLRSEDVTTILKMARREIDKRDVKIERLRAALKECANKLRKARKAASQRE